MASNCDSCSSKESCNVENKSECQVIGTNSNNQFKHIIGVLSGKGGVGKSTVAANLALSLHRQGYKVGVLDADITGPSIPRIFNAEDKKALMYPHGLEAVEIETNLKAMSLNFLLDEEKKPVIWRGPIITNTIKQFYQDVIWGELDYLIIDMPPGTGDIALTIMQSFPLDGIVMVSVPQDMVSMIVSKAIAMTKRLNVEVLGVIENMSYMTCPHCDDKIRVFESDDIEAFLEDQEVELLAELPINGAVTQKNRLSEEMMRIFDEVAIKVQKKIHIKTGQPS
ncbi:Mrp/NBP35 family ATP-binding protein [Vallitaleaceae bacterium 9-2]